jgi:hypothetical protein
MLPLLTAYCHDHTDRHFTQDTSVGWSRMDLPTELYKRSALLTAINGKSVNPYGLVLIYIPQGNYCFVVPGASLNRLFNLEDCFHLYPVN